MLCLAINGVNTEHIGLGLEADSHQPLSLTWDQITDGSPIGIISQRMMASVIRRRHLLEAGHLLQD